MSELEKRCPFGPTKQWEKHDALGNPLHDVNKGFKKPDKIKDESNLDDAKRRNSSGSKGSTRHNVCLTEGGVDEAGFYK